MPAFLLHQPRTSARSHSILTYGLSRAELSVFQQRSWDFEMSTEIPQSLWSMAECWVRAPDPQNLLQLPKETRVSAKPTEVPKQLPCLRVSSSHRNITLKSSFLQKNRAFKPALDTGGQLQSPNINNKSCLVASVFCNRRKVARLRPEQPSVHLGKESTIRHWLLIPAKPSWALPSACGHPANITG